MCNIIYERDKMKYKILQSKLEKTEKQRGKENQRTNIMSRKQL